ncbi:transposon en spm sub-class [Moniliophthora roreri MCA 2997]|uniref:Transposon en spm sub-class n=1 Tax=Moniliophthora roreri (strain MCA 2997) TaxID=1381753 RepID=V2XJN7_MONRO|nr:transposon en spm sub-class [Moniliophthora roreri MCA 2997]
MSHRCEAVIEERCQSLLALLARHIFQLAAYAAALYHLAFTTTTQQPYHTSALSGQAWINELWNGHEDRIACELGVRKHIFNILLAELHWLGVEDSRYVSLKEKLGIFLYTCMTALPVQHIGERFQRSNKTTSLYFHEVLDAFTEPDFYNCYVCLPDANAPIPAYILNNPKLYPFFKNAIGTVDGTHICCWPSKEEQELAQDQKGQISHNCLVCCSFDMRVQYAVTGYDGASADATMYAQSHLADLHIPEGKYYLADAGFGTCDNLMVPYRGVRYHLNEWQRGHLRPNNWEELFNLRHAQA